VSLLVPKLAYIAINIVTLSIAVYKCSVLGLVPTSVDWALYLPVKEVWLHLTYHQPLEFAALLSF
jgi:hypothetical protein